MKIDQINVEHRPGYDAVVKYLRYYQYYMEVPYTRIDVMTSNIARSNLLLKNACERIA
jgi:hypothetical protein